MVTLPNRSVTMNFFRRPFFVHRLSGFASYRHWYGGTWVNYWSSTTGPALWSPGDHTPPTTVGSIIKEVHT